MGVSVVGVLCLLKSVSNFCQISPLEAHVRRPAGVRDHMHFKFCIFDDIADSTVCFDRHRTFENENYFLCNVFCNHLCNVINVSQVCTTITTRGCTDGYKDNIYSLDSFFRVGRKSKALLLCISFHNLFQSRLVYGKYTVVEVVNLAFCQIGAYYYGSRK